MGKISDYIAKLEAADEETQDRALLAIIKKYEDKLVALNQDQLFHGRDSNGGSLREYTLNTYNGLKYALFKNRMNSEPGFGIRDYKLKGSFYEGFFVDAEQFPVTIGSNDSKTTFLIKGDSLFGLDDDSLKEFLEAIKTDVQEYYRSLLQF